MPPESAVELQHRHELHGAMGGYYSTGRAAWQVSPEATERPIKPAQRKGFTGSSVRSQYNVTLSRGGDNEEFYYVQVQVTESHQLSYMKV